MKRTCLPDRSSRTRPCLVALAPFWYRKHHLGRCRIERFMRWLHEAGWEIVLVLAGAEDRESRGCWGREIMVRDPLGLHRESRADRPSWRRKEYHPLVVGAAMLAFNPDPGIVWARRAARSRAVNRAAERATAVLASSPPESGHLAAAALAARHGLRLVVDLRDGWLDEPLKPALQRNPWQRWRERRLERRVLEQAEAVLVTSPVWRDLLVSRYPEHRQRTHVLTNCYPRQSPAAEDATSPRASEGGLTLVHAGQFTGSKPENRPGLLLAPLARAGREHGRLRVILQGRFTRADLQEIEHWRSILAERGDTLEIRPPVTLERMPEVLGQADGMLLLSATRAAIVAKIYDYIPTRRPVLALTPEASAVWEVGREVPQLFTAPLEEDQRIDEKVAAFLTACGTGRFAAAVPERYAEPFCAGRFKEILSPDAADPRR